MPIIPWSCSHGDAEWVTIPCSSMIELGAADSNRVIVTGEGVILSLGPPPICEDQGVPCTKVIFFGPSGAIVLVPSDHLALLGEGERVIRGRCFSTFSCDSHGHWTENGCQSLDWSPHDLEELIDVIYTLCAGRPDLRHRVRVLMDKLRGEQDEQAQQRA